MQILITGANGFIGRHLVLALNKEKIPLTLVLRKNNESWIPKGDIKTIIIDDFGPNTDWEKALKDVSFIINLAGRAHVFKKEKAGAIKDFTSVNCYGATVLFKAAINAKITGFIHISSIGVLGTRTKDNQPFNDNSIPLPASPYAKSKFEGDKALLELAKSNKSPALIIIRPPLIIGSNSKGNFQRLLKLVNKPIPLPLMGLTNKRTLLSVENLISAIKAVLKKWETNLISGTYVLADDKPISTSDIIKFIHEVNGKAFLFSLPSPLLAFALRLVGGEKLVEQLMENLEVDSQRFNSDFNWQPEIDTLASLKKSTKEE